MNICPTCGALPCDQVAGATCNDYSQVELLAVIVANAVLIPDPRMAGATDCYAVPLDDIEAAKTALAKARGEQDQ